MRGEFFFEGDKLKKGDIITVRLNERVRDFIVVGHIHDSVLLEPMTEVSQWVFDREQALLRVIFDACDTSAGERTPEDVRNMLLGQLQGFFDSHGQIKPKPATEPEDDANPQRWAEDMDADAEREFLS